MSQNGKYFEDAFKRKYSSQFHIYDVLQIVLNLLYSYKKAELTLH